MMPPKEWQMKMMGLCDALASFPNQNSGRYHGTGEIYSPLDRLLAVLPGFAHAAGRDWKMYFQRAM
jgi:hypothetical protein